MPVEPGKLGPAAACAAVLVLVAWLGLLGHLAVRAGAPETEWARLVAVLGSLQAVAFGAAGALFGVVIQRQRVADARQSAAKADERAELAQRKADASAMSAAKGAALAAAVKSRTTSAGAGGGDGRGVTASPLVTDDALRQLAHALFPDEGV